jgi:hypothetical protein
MWREAPVMTSDKRQKRLKAALRIKPISTFLSFKESWSIAMGKSLFANLRLILNFGF